MWYLVVPPIIVVVSLSFLVWYLSRKGTDPVIAQKVLASEESAAHIAFPRTKEFFLKMLEKFGQRFKVTSLRLHNTLHEFTQSVKARRLRVHISANVRQEEKKDRSHDDREQAALAYDVAGDQEQKSVVMRVPETLLATPIVRQAKHVPRQFSLPEEKPEKIPRPMVSDVATHPEKKKRPPRPSVIREEALIARIARDPKDFTAYEALGDYYLEMENIKDAKECYRQVLKLSPIHRMVKIKIRRLEKLLTRAGE
ncbi:MAG: tetratricopeptide repeat protein [Candidatus Moranbacteria bacterium]|nr:tetratricopeptide repeat protein [Candidatus Moranbacteria bacterium]